MSEPPSNFWSFLASFRGSEPPSVSLLVKHGHPYIAATLSTVWAYRAAIALVAALLLR